VYLGPLLDRPRLPAQIERTVDQPHRTIGLRKVAQHASGQRIELLREQPYVIAAREQTVEQPPGFLIAALPLTGPPLANTLTTRIGKAPQHLPGALPIPGQCVSIVASVLQARRRRDG
jgi:hypothetical protein